MGSASTLQRSLAATALLLLVPALLSFVGCGAEDNDARVGEQRDWIIYGGFGHET
jgi:hypothetical protein